MLSFPQQKWQVVRANTTRGTHKSNIDLISDRVYLGTYLGAGDKQLLTELGITHVVSLLDILPDIPDVIEVSNRLHVRINDSSDSDILRHLGKTTNFIKSAIEADENNKVLVHCLMGISRSATVVSAYIVATKKMSGAEAIAFVRKKRPVVCPNLGFRQQLDIFASKQGVRGSSGEALLSSLRQIKAWTSAVKSRKESDEALGSATHSLP